MAFETRGNGQYYYRKRRIGQRVISEYCGGGELAGLLHSLDKLKREQAWLEKESRRQSFEAERQEQTEIDQAIDSFCGEADALADALFLVNGYHKHSRQWRRKRNGKDKENKA